MNALLLALYAISHCAGFAGFTLMIALRAYDHESADRMLAYNLFLASFFVYLLPPNISFFARAFLGTGALTTETWYYVADAIRTSLLMTAGSLFFWSLPTKTGSRKTLAILIACAQLPLAGLALSAGHGVSLRINLMRTHVFLIAGLLGWACAYIKAHRAHACDEDCGKMMDMTYVANLAFIPVFAGLSFVNFGPDRPWLPLCAENVYYLIVHTANIVVLALGGFKPPEVTGKSRMVAEKPFPEVTRRLVSSLSESERNMIELMSQGQANKQIASHLLMSEHAIRNHMYRLFKRFGVRNRVELADLYRQLTAQRDRTLE